MRGYFKITAADVHSQFAGRTAHTVFVYVHVYMRAPVYAPPRRWAGVYVYCMGSGFSPSRSAFADVCSPVAHRRLGLL